MKLLKTLLQRKSTPTNTTERKTAREEVYQSSEAVDVQFLDYEDLANTETSLKLKDIIRAKMEKKPKT